MFLWQHFIVNDIGVRHETKISISSYPKDETKHENRTRKKNILDPKPDRAQRTLNRDRWKIINILIQLYK